LPLPLKHVAAGVLAMNALEELSGCHQIELSAQVAKATDEILGTLIDIKA
jgi:hypothetical protein